MSAPDSAAAADGLQLTDVFQAQRPRLQALAYRMLGVTGDAEDVVQDAWLRLDAACRAGRVPESPAAWLTTTVARLALDELRRRRRRPAPSPFVAEPLLADDAFAPQAAAEQREGLSQGVVTLFERLTPLQRATLVLRDALGDDHRQIAAVLGIAEASARQHYRRARLRLADATAAHDARPIDSGRLLDALFAALLAGDRDALLAVLRDDAVALHDGGGRVQAAIRPIETAERIAQVYLHLGRKLASSGALAVQRVQLVGGPAYALLQSGRLLSINSVRAHRDDPERIALVCGVVDPRKLDRAARRLGLGLVDGEVPTP